MRCSVLVVSACTACLLHVLFHKDPHHYPPQVAQEQGLAHAAGDRLIDPPPPPYASVFEAVGDLLSLIPFAWSRFAGKPGSNGKHHRRT